jgi:hypothetical protein
MRGCKLAPHLISAGARNGLKRGICGLRPADPLAYLAELAFRPYYRAILRKKVLFFSTGEPGVGVLG